MRGVAGSRPACETATTEFLEVHRYQTSISRCYEERNQSIIRSPSRLSPSSPLLRGSRSPFCWLFARWKLSSDRAHYCYLRPAWPSSSTDILSTASPQWRSVRSSLFVSSFPRSGVSASRFGIFNCIGARANNTNRLNSTATIKRRLWTYWW